MRHLRRGVAFLSTLATCSALALPAPALPPTAKKLAGKDIAELYDGSTMTFDNYTKSRSVSGTVTYNLKAKTESGSYQYGDNKGQFKAVIRIAGDKFCYKLGKTEEVCSDVYADGATIYEVGANGVVAAVNKKR